MIEFEHIGYRGVTFKADNGLKTTATSGGRNAVLGKAVTLTGDCEVGFGDGGERILGCIFQYEMDGCVTVQDYGYCTLATSKITKNGIETHEFLPKAGDYVVVDGDGGVILSATIDITPGTPGDPEAEPPEEGTPDEITITPIVTNAVVISADNDTAVVRIS